MKPSSRFHRSPLPKSLPLVFHLTSSKPRAVAGLEPAMAPRAFLQFADTRAGGAAALPAHAPHIATDTNTAKHTHHPKSTPFAKFSIAVPSRHICGEPSTPDPNVKTLGEMTPALRNENPGTHLGKMPLPLSPILLVNTDPLFAKKLS